MIAARHSFELLSVLVLLVVRVCHYPAMIGYKASMGKV